jgi:hypothetical protein
VTSPIQRLRIVAMASSSVDRDLELTTPLTKGADVKALQEGLNAISGKFPKLLDFKLREDRTLGELTLDAAYDAAFVLGLSPRRLNQIEKKRLIVQPVQLILRDPRTRSDEQKERGRKRCEDLRRKLNRRPSLARVRITVTAGSTHWGGANDVMEQFVEPFMIKRGLKPGSGKRTPAENAAIGGSKSSDHLTTMTTTMGRDFPTTRGEHHARRLARLMGFDSWRPNETQSFEFSAGGRTWRGQILWGAAIDHADHIHVGIKRL